MEEEIVNNILQWLKELIESGNYALLILIILTVLSLLIVFRLNIIFDFFEARKRSQIGLLEEARDKSLENSSMQEHYQDEIDNEYFRLTWKIRVSKTLRLAMVSFLKNSEGRISKGHLVRAYKIMDPDTNQVDVDIRLVHRIEAWFFRIGGGFFILLGAMPFLYVFNKQWNLQSVVIANVSGLICIFFGAFFASMSFPYSSAKKVVVEAERQRNLHEDDVE